MPSSRGPPNRLRYFDHAASTHAPRPVLGAVQGLAESGYANVHRGNHHLSRLATEAFEAARRDLLAFIGGSEPDATLCFTANTTGALEMAAHVMARVEGDTVVSHVEHHSNDLPHRRRGRVHRVDPGNDLSCLPERIEEVLARHKVKLVAVTGASNVTGETPDLHAIARVAHEHGARILVDAAQLLAHRRIDVRRPDDPEHLDLVAGAGHKCYAPFGSAFLYGPSEVLDAAPPIVPAGGTVTFVGREEVEFVAGPERHEGGTPNVAGAVAFAEAARWLGSIGMDRVAQHENDLAAAMRKRLAEVPGLTAYAIGGAPDRLGVAPFLLNGWEHGLLSAALDDGWGVATRNGCFCAQPLVADLLHVEDLEAIRDHMRNGHKDQVPGLVRASLGIYNDEEDVEVLGKALETLAKEGPRAAPRALTPTTDGSS